MFEGWMGRTSLCANMCVRFVHGFEQTKQFRTPAIMQELTGLEV